MVNQQTAPMVFNDRTEAGRVLASKLTKYKNDPNTVVLALPRGGVPVAYEIGKALGLPIDAFVVRKLGVPGHEEFAMGAIASGDVRYINQNVIGQLHIPREVVNAVSRKEQEELRRREQLYRGHRRPVEVSGKTVILVDDGLATGASMRAAITALKQHKPGRIVVAVPAAAPDICREVGEQVDEIICAVTPDPFYAVGLWYRQFSQTTDEEVRDLLSRAA
jgi:putative phosphoribosyl transferase